MSSSSVTNLSCARCHQPEALLSEPLKRCARCKALQYCSSACQKQDWPKHKQQCREGGLDLSAGTRMRSTMRLSGNNLNGHGENNNSSRPDPDTIYYLQTSIPHLHEISIMGPYYPLPTVIPEILNNYGSDLGGLQAFMEMIDRDIYSLTHLEDLSSPYDDDPNKIRTIKLVREKNAIMAAKLPGPAWFILETEVNLDPRLEPEGADENTPAPVKSIEVHGTFDNSEAAIREARIIAENRRLKGVNGRVLDLVDACYHVEVITGSQNSKRLVSIRVRHDPGEIMQ